MIKAMQNPLRSPAAEGASNFPGWKAVFIFLVLYAAAYLDRQVLTLLVDPIRKDLHCTDFQISLLQGFAFVIFFTLCGLPIGWLVDRSPRRMVIFFGMVVWSLAAAAGGLARSYGQLLAARIGVGSGEASLAPASYSILSDYFPRERLAGAMAVYSSGAVVGSAISLALGGVIVGLSEHAQLYVLPLIGAVRPWQLVFLVAGLPGVALAFLVFLVKEPKRRDVMATSKSGHSVSETLKFMKSQWRFYLAHFVGFSAFNMAAAGYNNWMPTLHPSPLLNGRYGAMFRTKRWSQSRVGVRVAR
jgi:MFS family permease